MDLKLIAKTVFKIEAKEISNLSKLLTDDFDKTISLIINSKGKIIVSGMGKSGIVGKKISATLASTGTPSFFLHPAEAYHGDLGMIDKKDVVLLISNSGETDEVLKLIPYLKSQKNIIISMTGNPLSTIAKNTNYHLNIAVKKEACPLELSPTSSSTAAMVMGDALAIAVMSIKKFTDRNFAKYHPGGSLGRRLLSTVRDVMKTQNLPICLKSSSAIDVVQLISNGKFGLVIIKDKKGKPIGVVSDGDIRRSMEKNQKNFFSLKAKNIMSKNPKIILDNSSLVDASKLMTKEKINSLLVLNKNQKLVGIIQLFDLGI